MRGEAGHAEEKAHHEVGSRRPLHVHPHEAHERRHPERSENHAHGPAEGADADAARDRGPQTKPFARQRTDGPQRQVDAAPHQYGRDRGIEQVFGDVVGNERPHDRADDRGRRHPRDDAPVDPPRSRVADGSGRGRGGGDGDVRPRSSERVAGDRDDEGSRSVPSTSPSIEPA